MSDRGSEGSRAVTPAKAHGATLHYAAVENLALPPRPTLVVAPAIFGLAWCIASLIGSLPSGIAFLMLMCGRWNRVAGFFDYHGSPGWLRLNFAFTELDLICDLTLLVASIACLRFARWGRRLMMVWAWAMMADRLLYALNIRGSLTAYGGPAVHHLTQTQIHHLIFEAVVWLLVSLLFPLCVLIIFSRRRAKSWFGKPPVHPIGVDPHQRFLPLVGMIGIAWGSLCYRPVLSPLIGSFARLIFYPNGLESYRDVAASMMGPALTALLLCASVACYHLTRWGRWGMVGWASSVFAWTVWDVVDIARTPQWYTTNWSPVCRFLEGQCRNAVIMCRLIVGGSTSINWWDFDGRSASLAIGATLLVLYLVVLWLLLWPTIRTRRFPEPR